MVHVRVASIFAELAPEDVQLIPLKGQPDQYLLLVATRLIGGIDEKSSRFDRWRPEDGVLHPIRMDGVTGPNTELARVKITARELNQAHPCS